MEETKDLEIICSDCGKTFTLEAGEIHFYESKGLALPKRCAECRKARKLQAQNQGETEKREEPKKSLEDMMRAAGIDVTL